MPFTPLFGTGFEMGVVPIQTGVCSFDAVVIGNDGGEVVHTGSFQLCIAGGLNYASFAPAGINRSDIAIGVWKRRGAQSNATVTMRFYINDGNYLALGFTGSVYTAWVNEVQVASGTININAASWHNIQVMLSIGDSGYIKTMIDGGLDIDYSGDTKPGSGSVFSSLRLGTVNGWPTYIDDLVIGYGDWPGDLRADVLYPNADTPTHDWLPSGTSMQTTPAAPSVALGAGTGITGDYRYKVTLVDPGGETLASVPSSLVQPANQKVDLSNIPTGLSDWTTARKIYRTVAGGSVYKLCATIADNTTVTYTDSLADGSLGANEPANVHYTFIDDYPANDSDYILTSLDNASDLHELSDWAEDAKTVEFVMQWARAKKATADTQQLALLMKSGVSLSESNAFNLLTSYQCYHRLMPLNPSGSAWQKTDLDGLQIGGKRIMP